MSDTEDFLDIDPSKFTIPQLKSKLNKLGVELPMKSEKKQFYIDLFTAKQEEKRKELEKAKRKREAAEEPEKEKATPKKVKTDEDEESSSAKKNRKRRQSNPFQGGNEEAEEEEELKPRRRLSTSRAAEKTETTVAVVEEVKEATPSRRSVTSVATVETTTTTTAPPSPSRSRRYTRTTEATPSSTTVATTPTRRTRLTGTLTQGGTETVPGTTTLSATTTTPSRRTTSTSATTPAYSEWRANRERRRSQGTIDTSSILSNVPITSADDADKFLTKDKTPEKPHARLPARPTGIEGAAAKKFDLISYLYTGLIFAWIAFVVALVFIGAFGGKFPFGSVTFCDSGVFPSEDNPCVPCPAQGTCSNGALVCDPGYVRSGVTCIEDVELNLQAAQLGELAKDYLARKRGNYDCNFDEAYGEVEDNLFHYLKAKDVTSEEEFEIVFAKAKSQFAANEIEYDSDTGVYYVGPEDGIKPLSCRLNIFLAEHVVELFALVAASALIWFILHKYKTKEEEKALARSFVEKTYEMLQQQKIQTQLAAANGLDVPPYIAVEHIRDALLVPPIDRTKRNRIWGMTTAVVHSDARVQESTMMLHGNQETVWEWIAPVRLPKEVLTPGRAAKQDE